MKISLPSILKRVHQRYNNTYSLIYSIKTYNWWACTVIHENVSQKTMHTMCKFQSKTRYKQNDCYIFVKKDILC